MRALLDGVGAHDPVTVAVRVTVLAAAARLACWTPVRRAASVDPSAVLRVE